MAFAGRSDFSLPVDEYLAPQSYPAVQLTGFRAGKVCHIFSLPLPQGKKSSPEPPAN
ncbi:hypothetical protein MPC4_90030 [Methylocella tundrae]|uniref:Uncharacterized protein n=1 Tax=Methylocella tundrae TaxID=227605 RepID=A0A8B6MCW1_METTU|nr:hypothetical protein MPC4_90030 [Methylocella tundrae]